MKALLLAALAFGAVPSSPEEAYKQVFSDLFDLDKHEQFRAAEVELGKLLFFDPRLAGNKAMSCASCHNPGMAWQDGLRRGRGADGRELLRNTPSLLNVHRNIPEPFFLDGRARTVEEAALTALESRLEMDRDARSLLVELGRLPEYARRFAEVYPDAGLSKEAVGRALGAYVRSSIRPGVTAFDKGPAAMSEEERRGLMVYVGKGRCMLCHTGSFLSDDFFHNVGVKPEPGRDDPGRYAVVKASQTWRAFRTPPLRDVARTAPYMHDGSLATLRDVVDFYDRGGDDADRRDSHIEPLNLTEDEKRDLVAFLESLTTLEPRPVLHPVLPADVEPRDRDELSGRMRLRGGLLARAVKRKDRAAAWAAAVVLRHETALMRRLMPEAGDCLQRLDLAAYDVTEDAEKGRPLSAKAVAALLDECRPRPASPAATIDEALARVEKLFEPAAGSCPVDGVPQLVADVASKRWGERESGLLAENLRFELLKFYEYRALLDGGEERCKELAVPKIYFGIFREGEWACRERHHENELARAFITRPPDFEAKCRNSVKISYDRLTEEDAARVCATLAKNLDEPDPCGKLLSSYLSPDKLPSCRNQFERIRGLADPKACSVFDNSPTQWKDRCLALSAFTRAWKAKDASLCGGHGLCAALMGDRKNSAEKSAAKLRAEACSILAQTRSWGELDRRAAAGPLLDQALTALVAAEEERAPADLRQARLIDERLERIARLRTRLDRHP